MSLTVDDPERGDLRGIGRGLDAFETSSEFRGPVESLDGHQCNDHFAQIYETDQQRFAAAIPFVRHGLDGGERVMYVVDEGNETEIKQILASAGIDVDGAMADGSFSIHTVQETYLREGSFEPDEMVEFYADVAATASEEYDALRIVAETTWLQDDETTIEQFMEYEAMVNELFDREDCVAICQYERDGFAPEIIRDILQTHPHLIYGDTVCHNFYYTPPAEFFGPEQPANEVDRMLGTLLDRTAAKATLERRQTYLRRQTEIIADPASTFEEKLQALFDLGCERFDLEVGGIAKVDPEADRFVIEHVSGDDDDRFCPGRELPLSETYCQLPVENSGTEAVLDPTEAGLDDLTAYRELGVTVYLGTFIEGEGDVDRTFFFVSTESRDGSFSEDERTFLGLMGQWASYEFQRRRRERLLERCYQITSAPGRPFDDKLEELLELGREWLDFDVGYFAATDCEADEFEIIESVGPNDLSQVGDSGPLSTSYCRRVLASEQPVMFRDAREAGWESDPAYEVYGMDSFLGTRLVVDGELYGTLCFGGRNPRDGRITDFETTFVDLLSQWVTYEIEQQRREARLEGLNSLSRTLMDTETAPEVAENVVTAVAEDLDLPLAATALYDDQSGELETIARTDAAAPLLDRSSLLDTRAGACWDAFVSGDVVRDEDPAVPSRDESPAVAELVAIPLCKHGVLLVGTTAPDGFTSADVDILETAGGTVSAALDRVDRERQVQERERTLEEQNETLERLNRINDTIRRIDQALVESTTREAVEQVVCEELASVGPYEFAWIGNHDPLTDDITPTELAGADKGYLEEVVTADDEPTGQGPAGKAVTTREPQVVNNVLQDPTFEPRCQAALNRGYHSLTALPLEYENSLYGVLVVYAGQPNVFDQLERTVLTEMADTIAHAINAVESKKALVSDEVMELEFGLEDSTFELVDIAQSAGCEFHFESLVPQTDGPLRSFGTVSGVSAATFQEFTPQLPVSSLTLIVERDTDAGPVSLFDFTLDESSLSHAVWQHGGRMQQLDVTSDGATLVVHLAADAEIREFVEMLKSRYPGTELTAQRRRSQPIRTETGFFARLTEDFTDRQREALQTAYFSGYFEQPRTRTASEIAATMDISQPTFNAHLRNALEKLCDQLFDAHSHRS